jgi:carboxyl-terminal processing protease
VRLGRFRGDASAEVDAALQALAAERPLTAVVLDLRGNPGGLLQEAVDLSGLFLPAGTLVTATRGRAEGMDETYRTAEPPTLPDVPLAILVDRVSASASEIVAGAIQDHDRGVIVGETTFGKGLVQVVRPLPYGTALKLTVSRYTTPVGREIQRLDYHQGERAAAVPDSLRRTFRTSGGRAVRSGGGIEPDLPVALGEESELEDALVRAASFLRFANRYAAEHPALPPSFQVDDALFDDFKRFVAADGAATYQTAPEEALAQLDTDLAVSGYTATAELRALRQAVEREKARDMDRHAARLRTRLRDEILSRYVGRRDVTIAALAADPALDAARGVLRDARRYAALLGR